jgi:DNA (cytosine-5)-methyltransferase 1
MEKGKDSVALMIGNALPPVFIREQAKKYIEHLQAVS